MLFVYASADDRAFWTHRVQFPVDLAYFGADGSLVTAYRSVPPCEAEPCQTYPASATRFVIATPAGGLDHVVAGSVLQPG